MVSQVNEREDKQWKSLGTRKNALMNDRHAQLPMIASFCELWSDTEKQYKANCSNGSVLSIYEQLRGEADFSCKSC